MDRHAFAAGQLGDGVGLCSRQDLAFHETTLDDELLGTVAILELAQDTGSCHRIFSGGKCDGSVAGKVLGQALDGGTLDSQAKHSVLDNHILHASLTQLLAQLGVILDVDTAVSNHTAGNRILKLCLQISDISLLFRKNLCTGHFGFTSFQNYIGTGAIEKPLSRAHSRERGIKQRYAFLGRRIHFTLDSSACCLKNSMIILPQKRGLVKCFSELFQKNQTPYFRVFRRMPGPMVVAMVALLK